METVASAVLRVLFMVQGFRVTFPGRLHKPGCKKGFRVSEGFALFGLGQVQDLGFRGWSG